MEYHVVTRGTAWAAMPGKPPVRLERGDMVMFPQGDPHFVSSAPGLEAEFIDADWVAAHRQHERPIPVGDPGGQHAMGRTGRTAEGMTNVVCGFWGCDVRPFNPLLAHLPSMMHFPASPGGAWVIDALRQVVAESGERRFGSEVVLEKISEVLFVEAVRRYIAESPQQQGWIAGLQDRFVGRALALLHHEPAGTWTLDELGQQIGLSRSALHERFTQLIGQPPMQYLAHWRMQLASTRLRDTSDSVATIARDVGYESEAAFSRAFKRLVGTPPVLWRRQARNSGGVGRVGAPGPAS